MQVYQPTV